jgi:hypothetical protein
MRIKRKESIKTERIKKLEERTKRREKPDGPSLA